MALDTKSLEGSSEEEKAQLGISESVLTDVRVQGSADFGEKDYLRLEVEGSPEPIVIKPASETVFGRRDPATGAMPDVDMTPFAGYRMGVSRRHAAIRFGDGQSLNLWDLGSSNGTYLNGERLSAHRPYRLHDGDEVRLGQMMIRLHFQSTPAEPTEKAEAKPSEAGQPAAAQPGQAEAAKPEAQEAQAEKPAQAEVKPEESAIRTTLPPITDAFKMPDAAEEKPVVPTTKPVDDEPGAESPVIEKPRAEAAAPKKKRRMRLRLSSRRVCRNQPNQKKSATDFISRA